MGTDYPNCVNFIMFMVRKLAVKCWLFLRYFHDKYPRNEVEYCKFQNAIELIRLK